MRVRAASLLRLDAERAARGRYVTAIDADLAALQAFLDETPDQALWAAERWRAFHDRVAQAERDCRALAQARD